jgi:hypothetical protein
MVGGAAMYPSKTLLKMQLIQRPYDISSSSKSSWFSRNTSRKGPLLFCTYQCRCFHYQGTVETLLKPENLKTLQTILTYHVVSGKMNAADIAKAIKAGNGKLH